MFGSRWFLWAVHLETRVLESYQSSVDLLVCPALVFSSVKQRLNVPMLLDSVTCD